MPNVIYDTSKTSSQCSVQTDTGETVRATLVNFVSGQIIYDKSKASQMCTVITSTGETVRAKIINVL